MKQKRSLLFVFSTCWSMMGFAANDVSDFDYLRLKSGRYEYSIQQIVSSNKANSAGGASSFICELIVRNSTNINVCVDKIISSGVAGVDAEKDVSQLKGKTVSLNIRQSDNLLVLEKTDNKVVDSFFKRAEDLLAIPVPKHLVDGMIWTNTVASRYSLLREQELTGHNGSNNTFRITSDAQHTEMQDGRSGFAKREFDMIIRRRNKLFYRNAR